MRQYDCRDEVFLQRGCDVLGSVVQATQMAQPDPLDVSELHPDARAAFASTLERVRGEPTSRILLILGEAGCGKTHLIRSLRNQTHAQRHGVIAYVHMTSECGDYRRYLLRQVVRSLSDPFAPQLAGRGTPGTRVATSLEQPSALDLISDALVNCLEPGTAERLREADDSTLAMLIADGADLLSEVAGTDGRPRFVDVDLETLRIFLYRQSTRKPILRRVSGFLNGEPLSVIDWQKIAALPSGCNREPMHLLGQIARVTSAALGAPLILCVDQIEASDIAGENHTPFLNAMGTACELIEHVPGMMVLLSCLDAAYNVHAPSLIESYRHRIENEPAVVKLVGAKTTPEIRKIISRRLKWLYEDMGLEHVPPNSVYPLPEDLPERLAGYQVRLILQLIHSYWDRCHRRDSIIEWTGPELGPGPAVQADAQDVDRLRLAWNEFRTAQSHAVSEDDEEQIALLAWALGEIVHELDDGAAVRLARVSAPAGQPPVYALSLSVTEPRTPVRDRLVGLCDKDPRGNGLLNQVKALEGLRGAGQVLVVARSTRFPQAGNAFAHIARLAAAGDIFITIDDAGWASLQAMRSFLETEAGRFAPGVLREWRKTDGPLITLPMIAAMLQLRRPGADAAASPAPAGTPTPSVTPSSARPQPRSTSRGSRTGGLAAPAGHGGTLFDGPAPEAGDAAGRRSEGVARPVEATAPLVVVAAEPTAEAALPRSTDSSSPVSAGAPLPPLAAGPMIIAQSDGFAPSDVSLDPQILTRHTAIFGANGSGKTVLGLTIVEHLLERGVGVILFDRKGDLASYALDEAWERETGAPDEQGRRAALRQRTDVHLYTPGCPAGRPLVLPLLPTGLATLDADERQEQARQAALILCDVCAPSSGKVDMFATVLCKAIELLCTADGGPPRTLDDLQDLLLQSPEELLAMLPAHAPRHCEEVGRRLNERRVAHGRLFGDQGERLDLGQMLRPPQPGRARLNIISTQFLDGDAGLIWVAQFLAAAGRFILDSPAPGGRLQGLLMFDEADQYVPANRKPATKPGMENLLRRARAAGVGVLLASQNVGDFDYKALDNITTAFAGKLTTPRALDKLRSRLGDRVERLPRKARGQFTMAIESEVREIKAHMSLIRPEPLGREQIERLAAEQRSR